MNNKFHIIVKNVSYTIISNIISMIITAIVILILPKILGVKEYGYWQLYLFYTSYVGFLHFGWNDGIYLRYGGKEYKDLNFRLFFSQFIMLFALQVVILFILFFISNYFIANNNRVFIVKTTAICMLLTNLRYMFLYILQATNRIKEYAQITILDRFLYISVILLFLVIGIKDYEILIFSDLFGKLISLLLGMYFCKEIIFNKISKFYFSFKETKENIFVGIKLMFANVASILNIGVVRFSIERTWGVEVFGKVSLTLSISNFLMIFVNAIGLVLFPVLRRIGRDKMPNIYSSLRDFLLVILFGGLILYFPFKELLTLWLPQYADSLLYMSILFPMVVYEGKMSLLINTYFKTLRKESLMLKINSISLVSSFILVIIFTVWLNSLNLSVLSIVIVLAFRSILGEIYLSKILGLNFTKDNILESIIVFSFILVGWKIELLFAIGIYGIIYFIYIFIKWNDLKNSIQKVKYLISE